VAHDKAVDCATAGVAIGECGSSSGTRRPNAEARCRSAADKSAAVVLHHGREA
jgi:hypothetical protein